MWSCRSTAYRRRPPLSWQLAAKEVLGLRFRLAVLIPRQFGQRKSFVAIDVQWPAEVAVVGDEDGLSTALKNASPQ